MGSELLAILRMYYKYNLSIEYYKYSEYRKLNLSAGLPYKTFEQWLGLEEEDICQK